MYCFGVKECVCVPGRRAAFRSRGGGRNALPIEKRAADPTFFTPPTISFSRGLQRKSLTLIAKLRKAKRDAGGDKPAPVRTHLRNTVVVPEMVGSIIGVYNGKAFNQIEVKPDMVGHYLGEFSISYRPVQHGKPGIGATNSSRFIPLK